MVTSIKQKSRFSDLIYCLNLSLLDLSSLKTLAYFSISVFCWRNVSRVKLPRHHTSVNTALIPQISNHLLSKETQRLLSFVIINLPWMYKKPTTIHTPTTIFPKQYTGILYDILNWKECELTLGKNNISTNDNCLVRTFCQAHEYST